MKRVLLFIAIALFFIVTLTYSQTRMERVRTARTQINALLGSYVNGPYETGGIIDVDSSIEASGIADGNIRDPYGTLNRCYLFTAKTQGEETKRTIGVFRDNQIIWMSGQLPGSQDYGDLDEDFFGTKDFNYDGKVDIAVYFSDGTNPPSTYCLWIFSWDGQQGLCINQQETSSGTVLTSSSIFDFYDVDGDGKDEIISYNSDQIANAVYSWNGILYGKWPDTPSLAGRSYTIANNLTVTVHATAQKVMDKLRYSYEVFNDPNSKQRIQSFYIQTAIDTLDSVKNPIGWDGGQWADYPLVNCFTENENLQIATGHNLPFSFTCSSLPTISTYYVQGPSYPLDNSTMDADSLMSIAYTNVLNNSFIGTTIGPINPPETFVIIGFLDTLTSYTTQSRTLGWITNQTTADKYLNYFAIAKTQLQSNNTDGARQILQTVVTNTISDTLPAAGGQASNLTSEAYALLRFNTEYLLSQLPQQVSGLPVKLVNSSGNNLTTGSLQYYEGSWKDATNNGDGTFTVSTTRPTISLRMTYEYGSQQKNNVTVGSTPVIFQTVNAQVKLQDSYGNPLDIGTVQYYTGAWRTFGTTSNGTASKELLANNYSFRMTYAYGSNDKQQNLTVDPVVVFQTTNVNVQLKNSVNDLIDQGTVQYYAGAWRTFGTTFNGTATKELLANNYSFRMTYAFGSNDKQQDLTANPTVVFQTVNAVVRLKNSQGNILDQGTVQYYAGAWRTFGTTINGVATKELLPNNYSFRMTYAYGSNDKQQNLSSDPTVVFQTVNATVQLKNSQGSLIDEGTVQYYSGAWRTFGTTINGVATKELLPNNYSFRMTYAYRSNDKQQNLSSDPTVVFQTINAIVQLKNSQGNLIDQGTVQYYSGAWRALGTTSNGTASKELLPNSYSFRLTHEYVSNDKQQDIGTNNIVTFSTVSAAVKVTNLQNNPVNNATVTYYSGAWRTFGTTAANGEAVKELLPANLPFRAKLGAIQQDKTQNLTANPVVEIQLSINP